MSILYLHLESIGFQSLREKIPVISVLPKVRGATKPLLSTVATGLLLLVNVEVAFVKTDGTISVKLDSVSDFSFEILVSLTSIYHFVDATVLEKSLTMLTFP